MAANEKLDNRELESFWIEKKKKFTTGNYNFNKYKKKKKKKNKQHNEKTKWEKIFARHVSYIRVKI